MRAHEPVAMVVTDRHGEIPTCLLQQREFAVIVVGTADTLTQIAAGLGFRLIQHVAVPVERAIPLDRIRRVRRHLTQQIVVLRQRQMLEQHRLLPQ